MLVLIHNSTLPDQQKKPLTYCSTHPRFCSLQPVIEYVSVNIPKIVPDIIGVLRHNTCLDGEQNEENMLYRDTDHQGPQLRSEVVSGSRKSVVNMAYKITRITI